MRVQVSSWLMSAAALMIAATLTYPATSVLPTDTAAADDREPTIQTPRPTLWQPATRMKCERVSGLKGKMCNGPRRTPEPYGEEAFIAQDIGLGSLQAAHTLLRMAPERAWVDAVDGNKNPTLLWPVEGGNFGRGFGYTRKERKSLKHDGIDIGAEPGELVRSVNDGIVAYSDNEVTGYGNMIMVVHKDASVSFYCHHRANYVFAGQQVRRGQVLGEVGTTGISRGPHLHFEWHVGGHPKDPMPRMVGQPRKHSPLAAPEQWL
jgi:murein DD-endopeptidase MepM/ murein hydrolase activator NlpD